MNKEITKIRCRVAPSPTGKLHLGTAHTALFNFLFAKHGKGTFILRIDDTDKMRSRKEFEEEIVSSLKWLGIVWDEGPDVGGPYAPYVQSQRSSSYQKYLDKLLQEKKAYYCFCTKEELEEERKEMETKKIPPVYSGKCLKRTNEEISQFEKEGRKAAIRLVNPNKKVTFHDLIRGEITVDSALFGDFVIVRSDGTALLAFAAAVDDIEMKITHAIRGEDFLNLVPRQILIYEALEEKPTEFAHLSFLYAPDKTKLSKRHGATSVSEYKEMGYLKEAMINYLGILGYSMSDGREVFTLEELIADFDISRVQKSAPVFDLNKLNWYNGYYIRKAQRSKLKDQIFNFFNKKYPEEKIEKILPLVVERIKTLKEFEMYADFFFRMPANYEIDLSAKKEILGKTLEALKTVSDWKADIIGAKMQEVATQNGVKNSEYFMTVRVTVTGKKISPPLNESMELLGKEEVLSRIKSLI